ncbi:MAG: hypothetical protein FJ271_00120 [Planctomycetes bacterium]|nr:hypothetical protein [Planctomycetota bacterium]
MRRHQQVTTVRLLLGCGFFACLAGLLLFVSAAPAQDRENELRALVERQGKLIEEQGKQLEALKKRLEFPTLGEGIRSAPPALPSISASSSPESPYDAELRERIERLELQNRELLEALRSRQTLPTSPTLNDGTMLAAPGGGQGDPPFTPFSTDDVRKIVGEYLKTEADKKKVAEDSRASEEREKGFVVGRNLELKGKWNYGPYLETADKSFQIHLSGRTQFDTVGSWAPDNVQFSDPGGIGSFLDAVNFRRARLQVDGWMYEVIDFYCEYDFLNTFDTGKTINQNEDFGGRVSNVPVPTELWIGINHLPFIRAFRAGNMKVPLGFEHLTSSRYLNFLERSYQFDAFLENGDNGFSPGFQALTWTDNERLVAQVAVFNNTRSIMGWNVGDGEWGYAGRMTWLPWYQDEGRYMIHLGVGGEWTNLDDGNTRFRARTLIRNGPAQLQNIAAFARMAGANQAMVVPEFYMNLGPFSIQAEYNPVWVNQVTRIIRTPTQNEVPVNIRQYFAQGAYVEALYFLTGENRNYVRTPLHTGGNTTARVIPYRNFYWVPGNGVPNPFSCGAWQVGVRYSYLDLTNAGILGGQLNNVTLGLNWYLNPNFKVQWNYAQGWRHIPDTEASGPFAQVGMRFAFDW